MKRTLIRWSRYRPAKYSTRYGFIKKSTPHTFWISIWKLLRFHLVVLPASGCLFIIYFSSILAIFEPIWSMIDRWVTSISIGFWLDWSRFVVLICAWILFNRQLWIVTENMYLHKFATRLGLFFKLFLLGNNLLGDTNQCPHFEWGNIAARFCRKS